MLGMGERGVAQYHSYDSDSDIKTTDYRKSLALVRVRCALSHLREIVIVDVSPVSVPGLPPGE